MSIPIDPIEINDASFDAQVIKSDLIVLTHFYASWSGPSKKIDPHVAEIATEYASQVKVVKVDIDQNPNVASTYGILKVPTVVFFKNGQVINKLEGVHPKTEIVAAFKPYLVIDPFM